MAEAKTPTEVIAEVLYAQATERRDESGSDFERDAQQILDALWIEGYRTAYVGKVAQS